MTISITLILQIIGASVLAVGIWTKVQLSQYFELTELYYEQAPYIMIGVGALILLVAIGGFYCTAKDKIALLYMVSVICNLYVFNLEEERVPLYILLISPIMKKQERYQT